jgi:hypothetical protein
VNGERYLSVSIESWGDGPHVIDDDRIETLMWALGELGAAGPAVGVGGLAGGVSATFGLSVAAGEPDLGVWPVVAERSVRIFDDACTKAGITHGGVANLEIMTEEYFDRDLNREPETYLGVTEVARELHVSRQRVSELRTSEAFPAPIAELAAGPVWRGSTLKRFMAGWERRPGRPRKDRNGSGGSLSQPRRNFEER